MFNNLSSTKILLLPAKAFLLFLLLDAVFQMKYIKDSSATEENFKIISKNKTFANKKEKAKNQILSINFNQTQTAQNERTYEKNDISIVQGIKSRKLDFKKEFHKIGKVFTSSGKRDLFSFNGQKFKTDHLEGITETKNLTNIRSPVRLTTKQGLILNQILGTYILSDVNNSICKNHMQEFKIGLRAFEPWALKMFDSSSKLMSGILNGNLAELGTFRQCLNIYENTVSGPIRGRHCSLKITPTDKLMEIILGYRGISRKRLKNLKRHVLDGSKLTWSVCVPDSCTNRDVLTHYNKIILEATQGLNLSVLLKKEHCISLNDLPKYSHGDYIYIFGVSLIVGFAIICTLIDIFYKGDTHTIISLFSLKTNANILFSTSESRNEITCLHGLRFLSMCYIVAGHRYVHNMATPVVNSMDLVDWISTYFSTTVHGGTVSVDTFFLVSSTLLSYNFCNSIKNGAKFNLFKFYLYRYSRIIVPLMLAVATYATVMKHFGNGPLYFDFNEFSHNSCQFFWWSAALTIQPFINPAFQCIVQTWFINVDMFWYYLSPIILIPLVKQPIIGYIFFIVIYALSILMSFYFAWINKFDGGMPVTPNLLQSDYFAYYYSQPLCRGSPYILGLAFGHALFKTKDQKVTIAPFTQTVGWILVSFCFPSVILISHLFHEEGYEYNRMFSSLFLSCHRSVWTFCLMWIIWNCHIGQGGTINEILSYLVFKILGRLGYSIYLFHFLFQGVMQNSQKAPGYFSNFLAIYMSMADIALMTILSVPITLCFEYPFVRMFGLLIRPSRTQVKAVGPQKTQT